MTDTTHDPEPDDHEGGDPPADLVELFLVLECDAVDAGFSHLNELREVLILEGKLDAA